MIKKQRVIAVIPARAGSKGLPNKNILELNGKPLICHSIEVAKDSKYIDRVICSTDCETIAKISEQSGCEVPFLRPKRLATDNATTPDVVYHLRTKLPIYEYWVILQPTSPLRETEDIDRCIELCEEEEISSVVSVTKTNKHPLWMYHMDSVNQLLPYVKESSKPTQRQFLENLYSLNGAIYVLSDQVIRSKSSFVTEGTKGYEMPANRSIDIDNSEDFELAQYYMRKKNDSKI